MKQIISFEKDIVFNNDIAVINSISLEHKEKVVDCEVEGEFCIFGDYKSHTDTTELENFKYDLPFSTLLPDDVDLDSIGIDIDNFVYEIVDNDVLHVKIDFLLLYDFKECDGLDKFIRDNDLFNEDVRDVNVNVVNDSFNENNFDDEINLVDDVSFNSDIVSDNSVVNTIDGDIVNENNVLETVDNEYIIYHIHIVQEGDTIETIMKKYDVTLDYIKEYNDFSDIKVGTKLIIPETINE